MKEALLETFLGTASLSAMFHSFFRTLSLLLVWMTLSQSGLGHQVDTVEFEFQSLKKEWRLQGEMDIAYMLPEMRGVPDGKPVSRSAVMKAPPEELKRIRKETEKTLRNILKLSFAGKPVDWKIHFPDFDKDPFVLPEEFNDWGLITVRLSVDPLPGPGELKIHWSEKEKAELIVLIEENTEYPRIVSVRAGGDYALLNVEGGGREVVNQKSTFFTWVVSGFRHVLPLGLDHTLFIFGLFLLAMKWRPLLAQSLLFTLAHSITLAIAVMGLVSIDARFIEIAIAFSIAFIGIENLFVKKVGKFRYTLVFVFGLLHGLGFANVLADKISGVPKSKLAEPLIGFNIGVEIAQVCVLAVAFLIFVPIRKGKKGKQRTRLAQNIGSVIVALAGIIWMIQRIFEVDLTWGLL